LKSCASSNSPHVACRPEVGTVEQILVHPDGAVDLALSPEQAAEREMQVDRLRIDLDHFE
jgi:hypothetical protein